MRPDVGPPTGADDRHAVGWDTTLVPCLPTADDGEPPPERATGRGMPWRDRELWLTVVQGNHTKNPAACAELLALACKAAERNQKWPRLPVGEFVREAGKHLSQSDWPKPQ